MKMKEAGKGAIKFLAAGGGIASSAFALKKLDTVIPASVPPMAKKIIPGLATALVAYFLSTKVTDDRLKALMLGLGAGGALDLIRKTLGDKIKFLQDNVPALSDIPRYRAVNTGGVGWDYYRDNSLQGIGDAYALNGDNTQSMQGIAMQGIAMQGLGQGGAMSAANGYALSGLGDAYALNG
jgi:hypothetical protein